MYFSLIQDKLWVKKLEENSLMSLTPANDILLYGTKGFTLINDAGIILRETPLETGKVSHMLNGKMMTIGMNDGT
jgi:hypothetical protein